MKTALVIALAAVAISAFGGPVVSTITPASGLVSGGNYVHIHGTGLQLVPVPCFPPCPLQITFGSVEAPVVSDSDDEIVVLAPPHAAGSVDVQVMNPAKGAATIANGYLYEDPLPSDNVRFLAPIAVSAPGAFGSNWVSELRITNASTESVMVGGTSITPRSAALVTLPSLNVGAFFTIPKRLAGSVTATLRVHDTSRDADNWGTDVPVVPETQFRPLVLLAGIPTDTRFRTLLRIYGYTSDFLNATVAVRDDASGVLLATQGVALSPSYAQLALDPVVAPLAAAHPRVRIEITSQINGAPLLPPIPLWAFVAVTNNTTQQVTTITPSLIPSAVSPAGALAVGHWAGGGSCVDVAEVDANVTMACAVAHFFRPATITNGRFEADGTYKVTAGPIGPGDGAPAHFIGVIDGNDLALTIQPGGGEPFTIHVTFGSTQPCLQLCV
jgi:hypothetical protein